MKIKKVISSICAAVISVSALAAAVSADFKSFDKSVADVPVYGSLSHSDYEAVAVSAICDDADSDNYQVWVSLHYTVEYTDGHQETMYKSSRWIDGGATGVQAVIPLSARNICHIVSCSAFYGYNIYGINNNFYLNILEKINFHYSPRMILTLNMLY